MRLTACAVLLGTLLTGCPRPEPMDGQAGGGDIESSAGTRAEPGLDSLSGAAAILRASFADLVDGSAIPIAILTPSQSNESAIGGLSLLGGGRVEFVEGATDSEIILRRYRADGAHSFDHEVSNSGQTIRFPTGDTLELEKNGDRTVATLSLAITIPSIRLIVDLTAGGGRQSPRIEASPARVPNPDYGKPVPPVSRKVQQFASDIAGPDASRCRRVLDRAGSLLSLGCRLHGAVKHTFEGLFLGALCEVQGQVQADRVEEGAITNEEYGQLVLLLTPVCTVGDIVVEGIGGWLSIACLVGDVANLGANSMFGAPLSSLLCPCGEGAFTGADGNCQCDLDFAEYSLSDGACNCLPYSSYDPDRELCECDAGMHFLDLWRIQSMQATTSECTCSDGTVRHPLAEVENPSLTLDLYKVCIDCNELVALNIELMKLAESRCAAVFVAAGTYDQCAAEAMEFGLDPLQFCSGQYESVLTRLAEMNRVFTEMTVVTSASLYKPCYQEVLDVYRQAALMCGASEESP